MIYRKENAIEYPASGPLRVELSYLEIDRDSPENQFESHVHPECEIYINLSGDVSFVVENRIYPIFPGNIIITRPYEYHHCVYHSGALHKHFWILFSSQGNESLFPRFFERDAGEGNLLALADEPRKELIALCHEMIERDTHAAANYYAFWRLMGLLDSADTAQVSSDAYPTDLTAALEYMNQHFAEPISIGDLAATSYVSIHTLERHFAEVMHMTPSAYLKKKRLAHAAEMLSRGSTVMNACRDSGFSDYSNFIALFKKHYGMTPLKYSKQ